MKTCQGFGDSSDWVFDSQRRGSPGSLLLCAPLRSLPSLPLPSPPPLEPEPDREPSQLGAAAPVVACASHLPKVGASMLNLPPTLSHRMKIGVARPSPCPSSPPPAGVAVAGAVTSRPFGLGEGGGGEKGVKKSQESMNRACARAVVGPQTGNQSPLPPPPEITFWEPVFFCGLPHEVLFLGVRFFFSLSLRL